MKRPIQYYYYYYPSGFYQNRKEYDLQRIIQFLEDTSQFICSLAVNEKINKGFYNVINDNEKDGFKINEWVKDVQANMTSAIRDLKLSIITNEGLNEIWGNLDLVGLTGVQLESKLNFWKELFQPIEDWIKKGIYTIDNAFKKDFSRTFKATNIILKSIVSILVHFEPLIELKDFLELSFEIENE